MVVLNLSCLKCRLLFCIGELHLTPLNAMAQIRPSFSYMDRADNKQKVLSSKQMEGGGKYSFHYMFLSLTKLDTLIEKHCIIGIILLLKYWSY